MRIFLKRYLLSQRLLLRRRRMDVKLFFPARRDLLKFQCMFLFFFSTGITAAYQELDTSRVVRISCSGFPKYFAILSRIKEEVRAIGADGGKIIASHAPNVQAYFPSGNT